MKKRLLIIIFGIILSIFIGTAKVEAANANITASKTTAEVGENVTIAVNFTAAAWNLKVSGEGVQNKGYAAQTADLSEQTTTDTLQFDTSKAGTYTIKLTGDITDKDGNVIEGINKTTTITVKEKTVTPPPEQTTNPDPVTPQQPQKSTNANLKNLGINPKDYDFNNFKSTRTSYTATVPNNIEEVEVWYEVADSKSTVKITGGSGLKVNSKKVSGLKEGKNTITLTVTAESGATKKYTITVTRKAANEPVENPTETPPTEEPEEIPEETIPQENNEITETGEGIKTLNIAGITLKPEFSTDIYDYEAVLEEDKDTLEIEAETTSEEYRVVIAGNEDLKDGENVITLIVYDAQNAVLATYQITVIKNTVDQNEINSIFGQIKKEEMIKRIAIISVAALIVILLIIYIIMKAKMKKTKNKEDKKMDKKKEDIDEEFFRGIKKEKEENRPIEEIKNSILIEEETEKEEIEKETTRGRRSRREITEENDEIETKSRRSKKEDDEKTETRSRTRRITEKEKDFENDIKIEELEDVNQTEKKKGKHF